MQLLIGTTNNGKIIEMREVLTETGYDIISPAAIGIGDSPEEEGDTFEANARQKARFYFERSGKTTVADDSGIIVDALKGELGIHTRRWGAGKDATDEEWIDYFLQRMEAEENRRATFVCVLCLIDMDGSEHLFRGETSGSITHAPEAEYLPGLPISACFKPDGCDKVYSALSIEEKNRLSHRGKAVHALRDFFMKE